MSPAPQLPRRVEGCDAGSHFVAGIILEVVVKAILRLGKDFLRTYFKGLGGPDHMRDYLAASVVTAVGVMFVAAGTFVSWSCANDLQAFADGLRWLVPFLFTGAFLAVIGAIGVSE